MLDRIDKLTPIEQLAAGRISGLRYRGDAMLDRIEKGISSRRMNCYPRSNGYYLI